MSSLNNGAMLVFPARGYHWREQSCLRFVQALITMPAGPQWRDALRRMVRQGAPLWGRSSSTGSFLCYSEDLKYCMAETVNEVGSKIRPFRIMMRVIKAIHSHPRMKVRARAVFLVHRGEPPSSGGKLRSMQ